MKHNHKLSSWIENNQLSYQQFAILIGTTSRTLYNYLARKTMPSGEVIARIREITNNQITVLDFLPEAQIENIKSNHIDYLKKQMIKKKVQQKEISILLCISDGATSKKFKQNTFKQEEIFQILDYISKKKR